MTQPNTPSPERRFWFIDEHHAHERITISTMALASMNTYLRGTNTSNIAQRPIEDIELPPTEEE